ncbi:hypothetical protein CAPTEDRAFT_178864 [Capitella teleta]|uniref:Protein xylosyltransferase n=1 Tax=Capitella teleta TaxID=283909 RepID=R7VKS1_CAPTE|nr:hypothetical protein CAPTEDRAFT_178864 [Capitella teleta]|eukprot:ELU17616.1 hypothetical protein CAPTEDRAFT_178864 [Capitella teleta]
MSVQRARRLSQSNIISSRFLTPKQIYKDTENCEEFRIKRKYVMDSITEEERDFPIAYSIVMYYAAGQAERLLRAIYRPQNYYCLHVDFKAGLETELSMQRLASCFDNVFVVPNPTSVNWAFYGVLEAELLCMEQLVKYKKWKYFINLTGHEFPLKSNYEIVQILKIYNGANEISNLPLSSFQERWTYKHINGKGKTSIPKSPPPHNITIHKGDAHVTLSRAFVEYVLNDPVALDFREWVKDAFCPEEIFFSSLQYNPQLEAPGALSVTTKYFYKVLSRHKVWASEGRNKCKSGNYRHIICIYGLDDLPDLAADYKAMFINKLLDDYEPFTYDCLEELYFNRTRDEYLGRKGFDFNFYLRRPFVLHHF